MRHTTIFAQAVLAAILVSAGSGAAIADAGHAKPAAQPEQTMPMDHSEHMTMDQSDMVMEHAATTGSATVGPLALTEAFTRATLPEAKTGGGYVTITNGGTEADRLVAATSPVADRAGLHEMVFENKVMKMRELEDGIEIPAGETVKLVPGGIHIMFMGIKAPFVVGEAVLVTLTFEKAGEVELILPVGNEHAGHDH